MIRLSRFWGSASCSELSRSLLRGYGKNRMSRGSTESETTSSGRCRSHHFRTSVLVMCAIHAGVCSQRCAEKGRFSTKFQSTILSCEFESNALRKKRRREKAKKDGYVHVYSALAGTHQYFYPNVLNYVTHSAALKTSGQPCSIDSNPKSLLTTTL
ncbi:hypothetical protein DFH11DRAFT_721625 [Phellopilus nigrolimitatus]|nr:hypothetical protein DFH11DRAFT_721625 [Phellopilus nigrolimitatus]